MQASEAEAGWGARRAQIAGLGRRAGHSKNGRTALPGDRAEGSGQIVTIVRETSFLMCHLLQMTLLFLLLLACIYVLRMLVVLIFSPGEYLRELLELIDTYATLTGTLGYVAWMSIEMFFLMEERRRRRNAGD